MLTAKQPDIYGSHYHENAGVKHFFPLASAPSRTLARRKLVRNRFTIDTNLIFHGGNNNNSHSPDDPHQPPCPPLFQPAGLESHKPQEEDTERWVEEQFDLGSYEGQAEVIDVGQMKETDILSDDDEYCKSVRAASAEPAELQGKMEGLVLQDGKTRSHNVNGRLEPGFGIVEDNRINHSDVSGSFSSCGVSSALKLASLKQFAVEEAVSDDIWVRREDFANGCKSDIF